MFKKSAFFALLILASPAFAQEAPRAPEIPPPSKTRIVADEDSGTIRFFIDGKEAARIDASGLHVRESIEYGKNITDAGSADFDSHAEKAERP